MIYPSAYLPDPFPENKVNYHRTNYGYVFTQARMGDISRRITRGGTGRLIKTHLHLTGRILKVGARFYNLDDYKNIYAVGFGKADGYMAVALEGVIWERLTSGVVNVRYGYSAPCRIIKVNQAGHPLPDGAVDERE